jgi:hypothetical protein
MSDAADYLDQIGGSSDVDSLKRQYRQRDTASKPRNALAAIEREILEEIACQSGRYGDRLEAILGTMATLRHQIEQALAQLAADGASAGATRRELDAGIAAYNRLREQAQQVQHYLIIHREAMGFWNHDDVFRCYPIPAALMPLPATHTPGPADRP